MSRADSSRPLARRTLRRQVMSWLISRMARIGFSSVRSRSTWLGSSSIRSRIEVAPTFRNVAYSLMFESPTITCRRRYFSASACGSSRVLMIGPAPGGGRGHALPDVLGPLGDAVHRAAGGLQHLAGPGVDLAGDEERDQHLGVVAEVVAARREVVLVAAVAVAGRVRVVLEEVDDAADPLLAQPLLRRPEELLEDPLPRLVVGDEVEDRVALRGGVLGVRAHVEVEPGSVGQEDVAAPAPRHHPAEEVAGHLVRAQAALAPEGAGDAVLVLQPEDPALHAENLPLGRPHS